jgi:ribosomal protein S16
MTIDRRAFLAGGLAVLAAPRGASALPSASASTVRPEDFGARGDGRTNDTEAFRAMSAHINRRGGGTIVLRRATYMVGRQTQTTTPGDGYAFHPSPIIELTGLTGPLRIQGNGARLKCPPGLRYGTFDPRTGEVVRRQMPNLRREELASPYNAMISVSGSTSSVEISDLELDGSFAQLVLGGPFGDVGHQIPATGLVLRDIAGSETVRNLRAHHHALDGIVIDGDPRRRARSRFDNVDSSYNARQGVSIVGGRGYDFVRCKFNHTGRAGLYSPPGAGVDIEAEGGKTNRDFTFTDCEFIDNTGCGMVADSGDTEQAHFTRCTFVGTTGASVWANKPLFRFDDCTIVGTMVRAHIDPDPARAAQFHNCTFLDDPARTPDGRIYLGWGTYGPIADLDQGDNVLFDHCEFRLTHGAQLPWTVRAIYRDCVMNQASEREGYPRGRFEGRTIINGRVDLYGSVIAGEIVLNGRVIRGE